ncbi:hypothetical protein [Anaerosacchariphilus polymeriproducens]|uniref:Uncharacterized protein n=1 Tax=Anaerosacchariphilus polymeriproducens TaxID=1812858 RepID=A0A371AQT3_9FIRM|nr:hypothetical protein [Anaerosacchariphilus polymeriproducens]RDU21894.1 hypothetical protein DWV06_18095 [Anaerosacchariphilus polymeriproducens]
MKVFLQRMNQVVDHLEEESKKLMKWNGQEVYLGMEETVSDITEIVTVMFENEEVLNSCGVVIHKEMIMTSLNHMMEAMEKKDDVMLHDALYYEILSQFKGYKYMLEQITG